MSNPPATKEGLLGALAPVLEAIRALDLSRPEEAQRALAERFPLDGPALTEVRALFRRGVEEGWLCERENAGVRFSRVLKAASPEDWSIDAVHMSAPGPGHTHPNGEVDLCFSVDGEPRFDEHAPGWTVYGPGSWHVPTVAGGAMDILYFLPGGAIVFEDRPA